MRELTYKQQLIIALVSNPEFVAKCDKSYDRKQIWYSVSEQVGSVINRLGHIDEGKGVSDED